MLPHDPAAYHQREHGQPGRRSERAEAGELQVAIASYASLLLKPAESRTARERLLADALGCLRAALRVGRVFVALRESEAFGVARGVSCVVELCAPGLLPHTDAQLFPGGAWAELPDPIRERLLASEVWAGEAVALGPLAARLQPDVQALVIAPLQGSASFWGSLVFGDDAGRHWRDEELELIAMAAALLANAIHRWEAEARLQASEARLRTVLTTLPVHCWMRDPAGRLLLQSDLTRQVWPATEGSTLDGLAAPAELRALWAERSRRAYAGELVRDELCYTIDGAERVFDDMIIPVRAGPDAGSIVGMRIDITERKVAEAALAASEERFRRLAEQLPAFVYVVDVRDRRISYANQGQFLGYSVGQVNAAELIQAAAHPDDAPAAFAAWQAFVAQRPDAVLTDEVRMYSADGVEEWVQRRGVWMRGAPAEGAHQALLMCTVITPLKAAEEARRAEEHSRLEAQKLESLGVLAAGVAHDFNNLLTAIIGHAELALLDVPPASPLEGSLGQIGAVARRAAAISGQILAYTGRSPRQIQPVNLSALLGELSGLIQGTLPGHVTLSLSPARDLSVVEADAAQLRQVLLNLISNAVEAIQPPAGEISLRTFSANLSQAALGRMLLGADLAPGPYVCAEVRDSGEGMDQATARRIFEPFFSTRFVGRGLGLAVVRGVVQAHAGAIETHSRPGAGTTMRIWLPARGASPAVAAAPTAVAGSFTGTALLIEDEERVRAVTSRMLERLGLIVYTAPNGEAGLAALDAGLPDLGLVLVDLTMPGIGGDVVARTVQLRWPGLPVVLMSGYGTAQIEQVLADTAPAAVLAKPFSLEALRGAVARALG